MSSTDNTTATKWIIQPPPNPNVVTFNPELAAEIGLNESIVLLQISFWISISNNIRDGKYWMYKSLTEMHTEKFIWMGRSTLARTIDNLAEMKLILIGNYNEAKYDKTQWFAIEPEHCSALKTILCMPINEGDLSKLSQNGTPPSSREKYSDLSQNGTTIPESNTQYKEMSTSLVGATHTTQASDGDSDVATKVIDTAVVGAKTAQPQLPLELAPEPNLPKTSPYKAIVVPVATEGEVVVGDDKPNKTKGGRKRAEGVTPAECINPMKAAIMKAFGWSWKTATTHEKGQVNAAAKQLCDCNFPVEQIPDLHKHCAEKFDQFGPMALTTNQSEFRKEHKPKQIAPELLAPQKKVIPAPVRSAIQEGWEAVKKYKIDLEFWGVDPSEVGRIAS